MAIMTIGLAVSSALNGVSIYMLRFITDYGINKDMPRMIETIKILLLVLLVILIVELLNINLKASYLRKSLILMKSKYISLLMSQDITQLQKENISTYRSNLINDFDRYEEKYLRNFLTLINMVFQFSVSLILVGLIEVKLVVGAFVLLFVFAYVSSKSSKPIQKQEEKKSASLEAYTSFVEESLQGFEIIKQHQLEKKRELEFTQKANQVQQDNHAVDVKTTHVDALNKLIQNIVMFGAIIGGLLFARSYGSSLGSIIVIASSFGNIMWPIQEFSPVLTAMNGIKKVIDTFDQNLQRPQLNRSIHMSDFDNLTFNQSDLGYDDAEAPILSNVDISVKRGEKVLIVGLSGAGKSTILKTLRQSIRPKQGTVTLDNQDIFAINAADYYNLFSTIDQIGFIFTGTVKQNITLFQDIDEKTILNTLNQVGLSHLSLTDQLKNNGSNLSGGQRARLMLARALCLNSKVILCDEIFSSLQHDIAMAIERDILALDKTIINVSHIIFKEHLSAYDKIYIVEKQTTRLVSSTEEVWDRMILSHNS